jgi:hypothetical protein
MPQICVAWLAFFLVSIAFYEPAFGGDKVSIEIIGRVEPQCEINSQKRIVELGSLLTSGTYRFNMSAQCNAPFDLAVTSLNGALKRVAIDSGKPSFSLALPYEVFIVIPTTGGDVQQTCASAAMTDETGCRLSTPGDAISDGQDGAVEIRWHGGGEHLQAGTYSDDLSFLLKPRL